MSGGSSATTRGSTRQGRDVRRQRRRLGGSEADDLGFSVIGGNIAAGLLIKIGDLPPLGKHCLEEVVYDPEVRVRELDEVEPHVERSEPTRQHIIIAARAGVDHNMLAAQDVVTGRTQRRLLERGLAAEDCTSPLQGRPSGAAYNESVSRGGVRLVNEASMREEGREDEEVDCRP